MINTWIMFLFINIVMIIVGWFGSNLPGYQFQLIKYGTAIPALPLTETWMFVLPDTLTGLINSISFIFTAAIGMVNLHSWIIIAIQLLIMSDAFLVLKLIRSGD